MRLYLSSFRLGDHPQRLVELLRGGRRAAVVGNATDGYPPVERAERLRDEFAQLRDVGLEPEEIDLRDHFAPPEAATVVGPDGATVVSTASHDPDQELFARLAAVDLVWVRGGNPFVLRRAAAASGFDRAITELLGEDRVVFGGYSAGPCLLAPSLEGFHRSDDPHEVPAGYEGLTDRRDGLGILPYAIVPHHRSPNHPGSPLMDEVVEWFLDQRTPFVALRDGDVLVRDGEHVEVLRRVDSEAPEGSTTW